MRYALLLWLVACGPTVVNYSPTDVNARYGLNGWPLNRLEVRVSDARPDHANTPALIAGVKESIEKSLSPPIMNPGDKLTLAVSVDEIVARLVDGKWKALARISARLSDVWGKDVANYAGRGEYSKSDTLGLRTAQLASTEATNEAIRQLLKMLDGGSLPVGGK